MRLLKIELCDVGPFARYAADLSGNVVYIGGPNGAGKSTILSAIQYAATGDSSRLGDREAPRVGRAGKDRPYVRLTLDPLDDGEVAVVTRWLPADNRAATRKLLYKDKAYTAKADIEDRFARWTGLTAKALSDFVFVEQGCLTDVVSDQTGRRAEVLQKLFGVAEAETGRAALVEHLAKLPQPADPEILATVRNQAAEAEQQFRAAEVELAALPPLDQPTSKSSHTQS
jgi:DNA repair exonuclease SbcCD ATPase subunit